MLLWCVQLNDLRKIDRPQSNSSSHFLFTVATRFLSRFCGFNDYLTLPPQAVSVMNLPLYSSITAKLADGSETLLSVHLGTIVWDNLEKVVPILASGYKPLLRTVMMEGYHLEIDFEDNGLISLEKLPLSMS